MVAYKIKRVPMKRKPWKVSLIIKVAARSHIPTINANPDEMIRTRFRLEELFMPVASAFKGKKRDLDD